MDRIIEIKAIAELVLPKYVREINDLYTRKRLIFDLGVFITDSLIFCNSKNNPPEVIDEHKFIIDIKDDELHRIELCPSSTGAFSGYEINVFKME